MRTALAITCAILVFGSIAVCCHGASPTPFDANKVDMSQITEFDIQSTIDHRNQLHQQLIEQTLPQASSAVKAAVDKAQNLQKEIDALALQAAKVPILEAELKKAHSACWRNLIVGLVLGAAIGFLGPKVAKLAAFFA